MIKFVSKNEFVFPSQKPYITILFKVIEDMGHGMKKINSVNQKLLGEEIDFGIFFGFGITVAIDEALKNAIEHGNKNDAMKKVTLEYKLTNDTLSITVKDEGEGFDYNNLPEVVADEDSGRGLLLIRNFMDEVNFNEKGNEINMIKYRKKGEN
ncbi:MAG: ATP-binding protein [Candidatus Muiribacteriota bacterium]